MTTITCLVCGAAEEPGPDRTCPVCGADLPAGDPAVSDPEQEPAAVSDPAPEPAHTAGVPDPAPEPADTADSPAEAAGADATETGVAAPPPADPQPVGAPVTPPPPVAPPPPGAATWPTAPPAPPPPGGGVPPGGRPSAHDPSHPSGLSASLRTYGMFTHLSAFAGAVVALAFVGPLVMWLIRRDEHPFLDHHGKEALNFNLSMLLYGVIGIVAIVATLGIGIVVVAPAALIFFLTWVVASIIAAVKANHGEGFRYPLTIRFVGDDV